MVIYRKYAFEIGGCLARAPLPIMETIHSLLRLVAALFFFFLFEDN